MGEGPGDVSREGPRRGCQGLPGETLNGMYVTSVILGTPLSNTDKIGRDVRVTDRIFYVLFLKYLFTFRHDSVLLPEVPIHRSFSSVTSG